MARLQHIDIAKGIGIVLVVWGHSLIEFGHYLIYMFHMPLFFYLSGIFHKSAPLDSFAKKRVKSLLLPLLIFMLVLSPLLLFSEQRALSITPPHFCGIFGPLWFLVALFAVSILYHALLRFKPYYRLFLCVAISYVLGYLPSLLGLANYVYGFSVFSALVFYAIGNMTGDRYSADGGRRKMSVIFLLSAIGIVVMYLVSYKLLHFKTMDMFDNVLMPNFAMFVGSALIGIAMIVSFSILISGDNSISRLVAFIGECSIYIFAFHMAFMVTLRKYAPFNGVIFELCLILGSVILGCALRGIFKKTWPAVFK